MAKPRRMSIVNRVGERHGRLLVTGRAENKIEPSGAVRAQWQCQCDCGNTAVVSGQSLGRGSTKSCGCFLRESVTARQLTHGQSRSRVYRSWATMIQRCTNPKSTHWASYGGRGIVVCSEWFDFENFYRDMGERPAGATLERAYNDKGYEPGNVIWATRLAQANNRRTNVLLSLNEETKTMAEWGRFTGLGKQIIKNRLDDGWPVWRALTEPIHDTGRRRRK